MKRTYVFVLALAIACLASCKKEPKDTELGPPTTQPQNEQVEQLKINQLQLIGSHNSYRKRTYKPIFDACMEMYHAGWIPANLNPQGWDYSHVGLPEQFGAFGMRSIELDIYEDAQGGRFYNRGFMSLVGEPVASGIPELQEPGFKILHIPDLDFNTNYYSFRSALQAIKQWSEKNANHIPIFILIESKTETVRDYVDMDIFQPSVPYSAGAGDALDEEIRSVFGSDLQGVFTPDELRGTFNTLREAVLANNWPTLADTRGKVMFVMEGSLVNTYKQGHPSLQGRAMFTYADPGDDEAAFVLVNDPIGDLDQIQQATSQGFIVRSRADSDTEEARTGDYSMMNAAISSGAQIISTDYYQPDPRYKTEPESWTNYHVAFPNGSTFRINPVTAPDKVGLGIIAE